MVITGRAGVWRRSSSRRRRKQSGRWKGEEEEEEKEEQEERTEQGCDERRETPFDHWPKDGSAILTVNVQ